ncbi:MAG: hypothetical protein WB555_12195, partial [Candidatus Korobacteraceae bacterium]
MKSVSETEMYRYLPLTKNSRICGRLRAALVGFTLCAVAAMGSLTIAAQDGVPLMNATGAGPAAQEQASPGSQAPDGVPSTTPTVVLDDTHTLPSTTTPK